MEHYLNQTVADWCARGERVVPLPVGVAIRRTCRKRCLVNDRTRGGVGWEPGPRAAPRRDADRAADDRAEVCARTTIRDSSAVGLILMYAAKVVVV